MKRGISFEEAVNDPVLLGKAFIALAFFTGCIFGGALIPLIVFIGLIAGYRALLERAGLSSDTKHIPIAALFLIAGVSISATLSQFTEYQRDKTFQRVAVVKSASVTEYHPEDWLVVVATADYQGQAISLECQADPSLVNDISPGKLVDIKFIPTAPRRGCMVLSYALSTGANESLNTFYIKMSISIFLGLLILLGIGMGALKLPSRESAEMSV